ncbi:hypothetical protein ACFL1C_06115 [Pseudomonadota bacterium]
MRLLLQILLLAVLAGCASPYRPVYISSEGDYYIEEQTTQAGYYGSGSILYADVGFYPWWITAYHPYAFSYYSPYFYPYYFSVWNPPGYSPFYGYHRGYYANWVRPHRLSRGRPADGLWNPGLSAPPPATIKVRKPAAWQDLYRNTKYAKYNQNTKNRRIDSGKPTTPFKHTPAKPHASLRSIDSGRSSGTNRASSRPAPVQRSYIPAGQRLSREKD